MDNNGSIGSRWNTGLEGSTWNMGGSQEGEVSVSIQHDRESGDADQKIGHHGGASQEIFQEITFKKSHPQEDKTPDHQGDLREIEDPDANVFLIHSSLRQVCLSSWCSAHLLVIPHLKVESMAANSYLQNAPPSLEWTCPLTRTGKRSAHSTCAKEFAKEMGFQLIETSDDGNCFFYTLAKFAKRSGYAPLLLEDSESRNAQALRQVLVSHIQENLHEYAPFLANNNQSGSINQQVEELRENGAWASEAGDLVPIAGANAFAIHINMYNIVDAGDRDIVQLVPIRSPIPSEVYVSIMRVREGHFQLLWPRSGEFRSVERPSPLSRSLSRSPPRASSASSASEEIVAAAHVAVEAAQMAVHAAQRTQNSRSLQNNEQKLNRMIRNLNQLSLASPARRSTRSTRSTKPPSPPKTLSKARSTRSTQKKKANQSFPNNNNNDLRRALEESLRYQ